MSQILYKSKNAVVVYKPHGLSSQPDPSSTEDVISLTSEILSGLGERGELYPVHRLDKQVGGVLLLARSRAAAAELSSGLSDDGFSKEYLAVLEGVPPEGALCCYLFKDARQSKAVLCSEDKPGAKYAELSVTPLATKAVGRATLTLAKIVLATGRFHQIRAQLSSAGAPIFGDKKYGGKQLMRGGIGLHAYKLSFTLGGEQISVSALPDTASVPWSHFGDKINELR